MSNKNLDEFVLPELVNRAKFILENRGEEGLINYVVYHGACGCMGPEDGDTLCPCKQSDALMSNMVEIVASFDDNLAKKIWLSKFVASLPG